MAPQSSQPGVIPLNRAIDHYFELALYLLVLTGFATLASTGGLDLPSMSLVGVALAVRGYQLAKRQQFVISEAWTTPLSIAYFVFFAVDYFILSRGFLPATVHLALFGVVVRMFSLRRERDHVTLAILAFLMVLASAVLTVDSIFLFSFAVFMMMAVGTFVLMEMRRSGHAANIQARHSNDPQEHRHLAFALARVAPALMVMILIGGGGRLFPDAPHVCRIHGRLLVRYGSLVRLQRSRPVGPDRADPAVRRGRHAHPDRRRHGWPLRPALARCDAREFRRPHVVQPSRAVHLTAPIRQYLQGPASQRVGAVDRETDSGARARHPLSRAHGTDWHQRLFPGAVGPQRQWKLPYARLRRRRSGLQLRFAALHQPLRGRLRHRHRHARGVARRGTRLSRSDHRAISCACLPSIARVPRLATQITSSARNDFDKAAAIENYLKTRFGYTLQLPQTPVKDPIANFLFERKQGHCEYFASAMAVMLRTIGIPSRVVNGFRSDEFNDLTGNYVVRAKDAHAWVEAYFPGYGWQTFDPTPAGNGGTPQGWNRLALYVDAMASFWRDWVVSYDTSHQYSLGQAAFSGTRGAWEIRSQVGAPPLRFHVEVGPPQPGPRATFARPLGDPRRRSRARSPAAGKPWPNRAPAARKMAAGSSGTFSGTGRRHVVSADGARAGPPWIKKTRGANRPGVCE